MLHYIIMLIQHRASTERDESSTSYHCPFKTCSKELNTVQNEMKEWFINAVFALLTSRLTKTSHFPTSTTK